MPKGSQITFNGGEFTEFMDPRVDVGRYSKGCKKLENFEPLPYGAVLCRPGTVHGGKAKYDDRVAITKPFAFSNTTTFDIEVGHLYFRFWKNQAAVNAPTPAAWLTSTAYAVDDYVLESSVSYRCIEAHTSGTFATDLAAGKWEVLEVLEVTTPYDESDLYELQFEQQNDEVYISHPSYADRKLVRDADDDWSLLLVDYSDDYNYPPLDYQNANEQLTISATGDYNVVGGSVDLDANHDRFESTDVGDLILLAHDRDDLELKFQISATGTSNPFYVINDWVFQTQGIGVYTVELEESTDLVTWTVRRKYELNGQYRNIETSGSEQEPKWFRFNITAWTSSDGTNIPYAIIEVSDPKVSGLVKIDSVADSQNATGIVVEPLYSEDATSHWAEQYFSDKKGHARAVCFHKDRRCVAGNDIWISQPGNYENFRRRNDADSGFRVPVRISGSPRVQWMQSLRDLRVGTTTAECVLVAENTNEVFAYNNYDLREDSNYGSKYIRAEKVNGTALFLQPEGLTVRSQIITGIETYYDANTLTIFADHILGDGVVQTGYQRQRYPTWHGVREDGQVASLLYEPSQEIQAWYRTVTDGVIESISVTPRPDEEDRICYVVQREVDGNTERHIEFRALGQYRLLQTIGQERAQVNSLKLQQAKGETIDESALAALEASVLAKQSSLFFVDDGVEVTGTDMEEVTGLTHLEGETVAILADGASMTDRVVTSGTISLDYPCQKVIVGRPYDYTLLPMNLEGPSIMGRSKNISGAIVRLWNSGPAYARVDEGRLTRVSVPLDQENDEPELQSGDTDKIHVSGDWSRNTSLEISGRSPLPVNVQAITLEFEVGRG